MKIILSNGKPKWVCNCGKVFSRRGSYLAHSRWATPLNGCVGRNYGKYGKKK